MSQLRLNVLMVMSTIVLFLAVLALIELLFTRSEFARGINWVYLPAGDLVRAFMGGILASAAPYLVYLFVQRHWGLKKTLGNLTPQRLLLCSIAFSLASPLLHHLWFAFGEPERELLPGFIAMATGDFTGTILVLYSAKFILVRWPASSSRPADIVTK